MTVVCAVQEGRWPLDIGPNLSMDGLREYLNLWDRIADVQLDPTTPDKLRWAWERNGEFSA